MNVVLSSIQNWSTHLSGNPIEVLATTSGAPSGAINYNILLKVTSIDGELEGGPFTDAIAPKSDNTAKFDISGIVDHGIEKTVRWPLVGFGNPHPALVYYIALTPGESYMDEDGLLVETFGENNIELFIVKGKLPEWKISELNEAEKTWSEYYVDEKRFFTYMPRTQKVSPYQPVKLWWKTNEVSEALTGTIVATFDDGSSQTAETAFIAYRRYIFEFDFHLQHNFINPNNGTKKVISYTCTIGGETFTFNVDWNYYDYYYYLLVDNQLGGVDCIWLQGRMKYAPTGEKTIVTKKRDSGSGRKVATKHVSGYSRQRRWIFNSGYKQDEMVYLDIMLDSPNCWLLVPPRSGDIGWLNANYEIIPVILNMNELELLDEMNYGMDNVEIEILEAH